jgi:hypothetical protein
MAEEQIIELLEEIRDLQKLHVENYKGALANQQKAIDIQIAAVKRQKITLAVAAVLLAALFAYLAFGKG